MLCCSAPICNKRVAIRCRQVGSPFDSLCCKLLKNRGVSRNRAYIIKKSDSAQRRVAVNISFCIFVVRDGIKENNFRRLKDKKLKCTWYNGLRQLRAYFEFRSVSFYSFICIYVSLAFICDFVGVIFLDRKNSRKEVYRSPISSLSNAVNII